jgi:hypothetical protein
MDLRCDAKLHGKVQGDYVEVSCDSRYCGWRPGVVVLHRFNLHTGLMTTRKFKNPQAVQERSKQDADLSDITAVRSA